MSSYRARQLPSHRGPAAWSVILGDAPPGQMLEENTTADVAVIGAGFAGLSAARRLIQKDPSLRVAVLDADRIGNGAAGRNSGFMIDLPHELASDDYSGGGNDRAMIALNRQAIAFAGQAVEAYRIPRAYFDPVGKVNAAASAAALTHNTSYAKHLTSLGEASETLDAASMQALTGSPYYRGGLYTRGTVMLQPAGYVRGLAAGLKGEGVRVFERAPVRSFTRTGEAWEVATEKAKLTAGAVILTVNGHLESFGIARDRLMQLFLFAVMTPELESDQLTRLGGAPRWGLTPSDPMGTTVRRIDTGQGGNRIVTRTCAALRPGMTATARDLTRAKRVMQQKFERRFPQLAGLQMEHAWAGHLCLTRNAVSVTREVEQGVYSGCVQNGLGTARGTLAGMAAADMALGQASQIAAHFSAEPPPIKLPPQPIREIGANLVLRWKEWRAATE